MAHANLLHDVIWYPDTLDPRPFLVYYISRPLVGSWEEAKITPAVVSPDRPNEDPSQPKGAPGPSLDHGSFGPPKKDIKSFQDLLDNYPAISRQMLPGLDTLFIEFTQAFQQTLPPPPSAAEIPDPEPDGLIRAAVKRARSNSAGAATTSLRPPSGAHLGIHQFFAEDEEDVMKTSLETAVTAAIDLFQGVNKTHLSYLGATTDLTGPVVERLIERYVSENLHGFLFPRLSALRRRDDLELESKIRQMEYIDISQLGLAIEGGLQGRRELMSRLTRAVDEFRRMNNAMCPQDMMDILLSTTKAATMLADSPEPGHGKKPTTEKVSMTINADMLVSLLLHVVIRTQVKYLQARLVYIRHFIFIDDVDNGEMGYALSTFEAVLSYLDRDSGGLRRASRRNKVLWDAIARGNMRELRTIMEPSAGATDDDECAIDSGPSSRRVSSSGWSLTNGHSSRASLSSFSASERFSQGSGLSHVFPFQSEDGEHAGHSPPHAPKRTKRVALDTRSMSSGSELSYRSRAASIGTRTSGIDGDTSIERLSQTHDPAGDSLLMMAVQHRQPAALKYLLSLQQYYPPEFVVKDYNDAGTTLFSAAVQLGHAEIVHAVLDFLLESLSDQHLKDYLAIQDVWGRSAAHYLFHSPFLIEHIGRYLPWQQKDKNGQTPLFALCRSYDHSLYLQMVVQGLDAATRTQGDDQPLHVDDHVDAKGNTLLHIVNDPKLAVKILQQCDVDVNATNAKRFTPLMMASKYGRFDMVRVLFSDARVDVAAREMRALTAVELAKDDDVRNKMDDLTLFALPAGPDQRTTGVVRSYFVEDASVRFVVKSGAPVNKHSYAVTTCRRSLSDFEHLLRLLQLENPASWIPSLENLRSATQIPSKPSRAVLKDLQIRMDWLLRILLQHPTFATHEMLWEFFLVPDLQLDKMEQRSKLKAETRVEKVRDELDAVEDVREIEQFVDHARDMVRSVHFSTRSVARRSSAVSNVASDLHESSQLLAKGLSTLAFLPPAYLAGFDVYVRSLVPSQTPPSATFFATFLALYGNVEAILKALARPPQLIGKIVAMRREVERSYSSVHRSSRWPLGLLDDTRQRLNEEREEKARRSREEAENLSKELRHTQQTVAAELAGWREMHERVGRRAVRELAGGMLVAERVRLAGMQRALRKVREEGTCSPPVVSRQNGYGES